MYNLLAVRALMQTVLHGKVLSLDELVERPVTAVVVAAQVGLAAPAGGDLSSAD